MHTTSLIMMNNFKNKYLINIRPLSVLDVGSRSIDGQTTYRDYFKTFRYVGMDIVPGPNVDIVGFENIKEVFDVVISGNTMEHVNHPWDWLKNLTQYFSKYICIIVPHRLGEHRYPIHTYNVFPDGMRDLFNYAGIKEVEIIKGRNDTMGVGTK